MRSFKYVFITAVATIISACSAPQDDPRYYYNDQSVHQLIYAIEDGNINKIQALINDGVNVNTVGKNGVTPLFWSYLKIDEYPLKKEVFRLLLKNGADPLILHKPTGKSILTYAAINTHDSDYLRIILEETPDINVDQYLEATPRYPTALYHAIFNKNNENVKLLIENGANLNFRDNFNNQPLKIASYINWEAAYILLQNGANYGDGEGQITERNPHGLSHIVWTLENTNYVPYLDGYYDWRQEIISFLDNKGIEVYPKYPEDDPRYNPRPEIKNIEDLKPQKEKYTALIENFTASGDGFYQYLLSFENEELVRLKISSNQYILEDTYSAMADFKIEGSKAVLSAATMENSSTSTVINLKTDKTVQQDNLANFNIDDLGLLNEEGVKISLNFIEASMSIEEIIQKYGTIEKAKSYNITDM